MTPFEARLRLPLPDERRDIRERAGVRVRELAERVGTWHSEIVRWETGERPVSPRFVVAYVQALDEMRDAAIRQGAGVA